MRLDRVPVSNFSPGAGSPASQHEAFSLQESGEDPSWHEMVVRLLDADRDMGDFLSAGVFDFPDHSEAHYSPTPHASLNE